MHILTQETIGYINVFESLTKAHVKDIIKNSELMFIVKEGDAAKAIGRNGINIRKIGRLLKKKIKVVEFNSEVERFVENIIRPTEGKVYKDGENVVIEAKSVQDKANLLGKNRRNLNQLNSIVKKYFDVDVRIK